MCAIRLRLWTPLLVVLFATPSAAQHVHPPPPAGTAGPERLGEIRFPTSARNGANAVFEKGVLYLHNFHYPQALAAFREARALDPGDAMSAAFEALAHTRPVWNYQDTAAARAALRSLAPTRAARLAAARTPRERAWVDAIEALYDGNVPKAVRDTAFSRKLEQLHASEPTDPEAAAFHALWLLALNQGEREPRAYARAEAVADSVRRRHPRHPGALHYLIHAVDDPENATRGLEAAAAYADVATSASHALHMTSHIFIALGMWPEVVRANRQAHAAQPPHLHGFGHGTHWLSYGLMQQGQVAEARMWVDSMLRYHDGVRTGQLPAVRGAGDAAIHAALMTASFVVDAEAWDSPLARLHIDTTTLDLHGRTVADFFVGFAAARRAARPMDLTPGSLAADRTLAASMHERIAARIRATPASARPPLAGEAEVMERILAAELQVAAARPDSAVALLRAAAERLEALPFMFGPPLIVKSPRERAGEILLATGRAAEALGEFDRADRLTPGRTHTRLRRARALHALGRRDDAVREYRGLAETWAEADVTFPFRLEARWGSTILAASAADARVAVDTMDYASVELRLRGTLYRPTGPGRHPALVVLHGSRGCWRAADMDLLGRLFAEHGYVAFFPCRRGVGLSAGQGVAVIEQLEREGLTPADARYGSRSTELLTTTQLQDVRAAITAVRARADVDAERVGVTGISFGGILTMLAAEADPTLRAAVAFAPAAMNWGWNSVLRERLLLGARRTRVPVMVLQAENDWHTGPAHELPEAVRAAGGDARGKIYPAIGGNVGEGHGLMLTAPELWQADVFSFLAANLRGGGEERPLIFIPRTGERGRGAGHPGWPRLRR